MKNAIKTYLLITLGSLLYALATDLFIFPHKLLLGGTSGISVIFEAYLPFSPGIILVCINFALIALAFLVLGSGMAIKTFVGSTLTTVFIGVFEPLGTFMPMQNCFISALTGAAIIAFASGIMFYVDSSSGGTDIVALIVRKYSSIDIGKSLLLTDFLIVIVGGILSGYIVAISSFFGLLIKTLGIDLVIDTIKKHTKKAGT